MPSVSTALSNDIVMPASSPGARRRRRSGCATPRAQVAAARRWRDPPVSWSPVTIEQRVGVAPLELERDLHGFVERPQLAHQRGGVVAVARGVGVLVLDEQDEAAADCAARAFSAAAAISAMTAAASGRDRSRSPCRRRRTAPAARHRSRARSSAGVARHGVALARERRDHVAAVLALAAGMRLPAGTSRCRRRAARRARARGTDPRCRRESRRGCACARRTRPASRRRLGGRHEADALALRLGRLHGGARGLAVGPTPIAPIVVLTPVDIAEAAAAESVTYASCGWRRQEARCCPGGTRCRSWRSRRCAAPGSSSGRTPAA